MDQAMFLVLMSIICLNVFLPPVMKRIGYKVDRSILCCGITGYCGNVPADPAIIKMLMMYNQERGEDSTGWAVNDTIVKDTEKVTKFITKYSLDIADTDENFTIVAHARKASSGSKHKKELAHPFGIRENEDDKDSPYNLILAMNGTLLNTSLIAEKFNEEYKISDNSDTQILARIMSKLGEENFKSALELYDGTATLLFYNPSKKNTLIVYKDPERSLHCWSKSDNELYISSMPESLQAIGAPSKDIRYFEGDKLYYIKDGVIALEEKVIRTPLRPVVDFKKHSAYNRDNAYYNSEYKDFYQHSSTSITNIKSGKIKTTNLRERATNSESHKNRGSRVYTVNEKYYRNGHALSELNYITDSGKLKSHLEAEKDKSAKPYYFINGYLCKCKDDYEKILNRCSDVNGKLDIRSFQGIKISELIDSFEYPVLTLCDDKEVWILNSNYESTLKAKGEKLIFAPFLSDEKFELIRTNKWTNGTRKIMCSVGEVKKINESVNEIDRIEEVTSDEYEPKTIKFFTSKLLTDVSDSPHYYFSLLKKDLWKLNNSQVLKEYFFTLMLKLAKMKEQINEKKFNQLLEEGKASMFSGAVFGTDMQKLLVVIRNTLKLEDSVTSTDDGTADLTTKEKIEILSKTNNFSEYDLINSISTTNTFCTTKGFDQAVYCTESPTLEEFCHDWISDQYSEKDMYDLYEAILVILSVCGRIDEGEVLYALDANGEDLKKKTKETYENWYAYIKDVNTTNADKDSPEEKSKNLKEEELAEVKGTEYYEKEFQSEANECIELIKDMVSRMEKVERDQKNENFISLEERLRVNLIYLEEKIYKK